MGVYAEPMWRSQRITCGNWFSPSPLRILGIKFRLSGLMKTALYPLNCVQSLGKERCIGTGANFIIPYLPELGHLKMLL